MEGNLHDDLETSMKKPEPVRAENQGPGSEEDSQASSRTAVSESSNAEHSAEKHLPDRYVVRPGKTGDLLSCLETPNIVARIERGFCLSAAAARKHEPGAIFIDGAAQGPPFLDTEKHLYNLDHHEDCVRSFTLSTCEQAYILVRKGLNLQERDWVIYANDPDLDTLLAIWVFLNHRQISNESHEIRQNILPLLRLEGLIDVHGLEMQELVCFSSSLYQETSSRISQLLEGESNLKQEGRWDKISFTHYTADTLRKIDQMVYAAWHFEAFNIVDELTRAQITDRHIAVICSSNAGIYEVERELVAVHGQRLGIIVLQKNRSNYTVRQVNLFLPVNLHRIYYQLNLMDPAASRGSAANRWGGSADIGGQPRHTGTKLNPAQIAEALLRAFHKPTAQQVFSTSAAAVITTTIVLVSGWSTFTVWKDSPEILTATFLASSGILLFHFSRQYPRIYGFQLPVGIDWLFLLPVAVAGALLGGAWVPVQLLDTTSTRPADFVQMAILGLGVPLAAEILFRTLVHGLLAEELQTQRSGGRWFISWPVIGSSLLYVITSLTVVMPSLGTAVVPTLFSIGPGPISLLVQCLGAVLLAVACGMARERSGSIVPAVLLHCFCLILLVVRALLHLPILS